MKELIIITVLTITFLNSTRAQQYVQGSPSGIMLEHSYTSSFDYYYFCSDGLLMKDVYYFDIKKYGTWKLSGDSILMNFTKTEGLRGIGEPQDHPTGINLDYYEEMVYFVEYIDEKEYLIWSQIVASISEDEQREFEIWTANIDCSSLRFDTELPGNYYMASSKKLTDSDLEKLSANELRLMRNEIFARYGYIFKSVDLKNHFDKKDWYKPELDNVDRYLTDIEKANIKLIKQFER